ncbi:MAG TPA: tetratricopeptide repeat protein [Pyrinomonadaceae bacterium]|nr:tetratricopeptide repeat protein [Pyrinomonadaceae bacterium]
MKRIYCVWLALFILTLPAAAATTFAQGSQTLQGKAVTPNGTAPVQPVKVTLTLSGRRIYETFTDLSGNFSFSGLSNGNYELTAEGDNVMFETTSVRAEVTAFGSSPQTFTQNIQLRPKQVTATPRAAVVSAFKQDVPKQARETLERAKKMADQGRVELALSLMREAIKLFPDYFDARLELGNELLQTGKLEEAITELDHARRINPDDDRAYQSFGLVLMQQKKYQIAVAVFSEASRLNPTNPMNPLMRALALIRQASTIEPTQSAAAAADREFLLARAEVALTQASELSGKKLTADHLSLALFYEMKGERARAADELEQYLRKNPDLKNADSIREAIKRLRETK